MSIHRAPGTAEPTRGVRPTVRRLGALGLVLVVLYYLAAQGALIRDLTTDLAAAEQRAETARVLAATDRVDLEARLDSLQVELELAREEVAALREQLISAGLTPVSPPAAAVEPWETSGHP